MHNKMYNNKLKQTQKTKDDHYGHDNKNWQWSHVIRNGRQFLFHISQNNTEVLRVHQNQGIYILQKWETTLIKRKHITEHTHTSKISRKQALIKQTNRQEMLSPIVLYLACHAKHHVTYIYTNM